MKSETWSRIGVGAFLFVGMLWKFPGLYIELKAWQTAIAALLGFGGLIWAVTLSARKQRERDDHIRDQDIQALARGLKAEISNITLFLEANINTIENYPNKSGFNKESTISLMVFEQMCAIPTAQLYERCIEKIGFLPDKTSNVVMAYYEALITTKNLFSSIVREYPGKLNLASAQEIANGYKDLSTIAQTAIASLDKFLEKNGGGAA